MSDEVLKRLKARVVPRIKMDLSVIESRYKNPEKRREEPTDDDTQISEQAQEYLKDILVNPDVPVTTRGDRLGYTSHMTNKVKSELISKKLVTQYEVNLGRVNKFLEITEEGYAFLAFDMPEHRGKGSPGHRYWQRRIRFHYQDVLGLEAKVEGHKGGKSVDVAVRQEDGRLLAVEIAMTPKNEMRNIKEDLAVGFHRVVVACKSRKVKQEVERRMEKSLDGDEKDRVDICLLTDFL